MRKNRCVCSHGACGLLKVNVPNSIINPCTFRRVISALEVKIHSFMTGILGRVLKQVITELGKVTGQSHGWWGENSAEEE